MNFATEPDLRQQIVNTYENGEGTQKLIAKQFSISIRTVKKLFRLKRETGDIKPKKHTGGPKPMILDSALQHLKDLVAE